MPRSTVDRFSMTAAPRFSVVIPTKERAETLRYSLATCLSQDYDNLEIIVSDNFSADGTRELVGSFADPRIRYVNTGRRLAMADNFEFGYRAVTGDYVFYLGDDDALLPGAVSAAASLLAKSRLPALSWSKVQYIWPSDGVRGHLQIAFDAALYEYPSRTVLKQALWFVQDRLWFPWTRLPVIMNSFVSNEVLKKLRDASGRLFWSSQPDVYSGFAIAAEIDSYLFSLRPLSVNGGSKYSNGRSGSAVGARGIFAEQFALENENSEALPDGKLHVRGSIVSCVLEGAHYANKHAANGRSKINYQKFVRIAAAELADAPEEVYRRGLQDLARIGREFAGWAVDADELARSYPNHPVDRDRFEYGWMARSGVSFDPQALGLTDVAAAAEFAGGVLPPYPDLSRVRRYNVAGRIIGRVFRAIASRVPDKSL